MRSLPRQIRLVGAILIVAFLALVAVLFFAFFQNRTFNERVCDSQNDGRTVFRSVLLLSKAQQSRGGQYPVVLRRKDGTEEAALLIVPENESGKKFYDSALKLTRPIEC